MFEFARLFSRFQWLIDQTDPHMLPWLRTDDGATKFILGGANIMCPGLTSPGATIHEEVDAETVVVSLSCGIIRPNQLISNALGCDDWRKDTCSSSWTDKDVNGSDQEAEQRNSHRECSLFEWRLVENAAFGLREQWTVRNTVWGAKKVTLRGSLAQDERVYFHGNHLHIGLPTYFFSLAQRSI